MELFIHTFLKFCYTIGVVFILARFLYYPGKGQKEYLFTYILLATMISLLCVLILRVEISFGLALGIFAIFSLMRYRTTSISPREMTYMFISAGIAAKNHLAPEGTEIFKFLVTDGIILLLAGASEFFLFRDKYISKILVYNNLELIHPDRRKELIEDLYKRYGLTEVKSIKVGRIDAVKNSARLQIKFLDTGNANFDDE